MCELLGMSANVPTDICFSFTGLVERGGRTGPHRDGWGLVFYEHAGYREFKDYLSSVESPIAELLKRFPIKAETVISHIRQANMGEVRLENTHPFVRELWGTPWVYAHNGQVETYHDFDLDDFQPIGTTDSEHLFCSLLARIKSSGAGDRHRHFQEIERFADAARGQGVFNLLLSDGDFLLAYCSTKLHWITRQAPFGKARLKDTDVTIDFRGETGDNDIVTVVATEPLTEDESWHKMEPGEMCVWKQGTLYYHRAAPFDGTQNEASPGVSQPR